MALCKLLCLLQEGRARAGYAQCRHKVMDIPGWLFPKAVPSFVALQQNSRGQNLRAVYPYLEL